MFFANVWTGLAERSFTWLVDATIKTTIVLILATFLAFLLRRSSAALRHRIWALGLSSALVVPFLSIVAPQWQLQILPSQPVPASNHEFSMFEREKQQMAAESSALLRQESISNPVEQASQPDLVVSSLSIERMATRQATSYPSNDTAESLNRNEKPQTPPVQSSSDPIVPLIPITLIFLVLWFVGLLWRQIGRASCRERV